VEDFGEGCEASLEEDPQLFGAQTFNIHQHCQAGGQVDHPTSLYFFSFVVIAILPICDYLRN
jgi:hypothetical protein